MQQPPDNAGQNLAFDPHMGGEDSLSSFPRRIGSDGPSIAGASAPSSATPATPPRIRRRNRMITSCLECRRRKLKCDKSHPCANCTKFTRDCVFLAPALDSASQLKLTEIKEKMGSLERVLEQDVAKNASRREARKAGLAAHALSEDVDFAPEPEDEKELEPTPLAVIDAVYEDDADDDLMDLGIQMGKLRLTDRLGGFFRPKMSDEITVSLTDSRNDRRSPSEKAMSPDPSLNALARPRNYMAPGPTYIPPTSNFFFAAGNQGNSLIDFLPSKSAADRLLQQYWYAVHALTHVVHRPSFERRYQTFWNEVDMGIEPVGSLQALVFAAMFSGVVSMPEEFIMHDFGVGKKDLVDNFQQGAETSLVRANLLRTTKIETMQAFVMYMIPLCRDQMSRAHSALVGTAIRLAECMGLHRDGTEYGMKPLDVHVRRCIWYQLCFLDIRTCEAQGPRPGIRLGEFDTQLPLNLDDQDFEQPNPPKRSSDRWTDMTFALIRMECNEMMRGLWFDRPRLEKKEISLTAVLGKIENFKKVMNEKYVPMLDDNIPIQRCAHLILEILLTRMHIMILHRYHNSVSAPIPDRLRQIILTSGTSSVESAMTLETDRSLSPWVWYSGAIQQYQTAFLLLAEVFAYPRRREADRIWRVLDYVFEPPLHLDRDQKARLILTEVRDRLGVYRDVRKLRAPTGMLARIGQRPIRKVEDNLSMGPSKPGEEPVIIFGAAVERLPNGMPAHPEVKQAPMQEFGRSGSMEAQAGPSPETALGDDLMADIDWNEWDKLFPPEINTGDLNDPSYT